MSAKIQTVKIDKKRSGEPTIWQRYSPRGECPMSFTASAVLHLIPLLAVMVLGWGILSTTGGEHKPPEMDVVEIEGEGGGLGGVGIGIGKNDSGASGNREGAQSAKGGKRVIEKVSDYQFKDLPKQGLDKAGAEEGPIDDGGDVWAKLDREQSLGKKIMASQDAGVGSGPADGFKGGVASGTPGGAGGATGKGLGNNPKGGAGKGNSPTGKVLEDQRRKELRWQILASDDGDSHLKKLQALKVTLMVPIRSKPGYALRFDLSKPTFVGQEVRAEDDAKKVRWKNDNQKEMFALAKAMGLKEVPPFTVIYLPKDLEADMARRELSHMGRSEHEIVKTVWDLRERDGAFDNEPFIVQQFLRPGVK